MVRLGQYELLARLGSGGAANVFLARDDERAGLVALKVLHPSLSADRESLTMFFAEARIAARLSHPNVVGILAFGRTEGVHALAMEYVFGASLGELLGQSGRSGRALSVGAVLAIVAGALDGLHHAHELRDPMGQPLNLVHRDLTAQNVLVGFDGIPRVADFGIAKATDRGFETRANVVKGKFAYMSPEQTLGRRVDRRTDIFAAGILLWESLTGRVLFDAPSPIEALENIRSAPIEAPSRVASGLSPLVDPLVLRALARNPDARFATAAEMRDEIRALLAEVGLNVGPRQIAIELAGLYGPTISERSLVLRAAEAGEADGALVSEALGVEPLDARSVPLIPGGTSDRDPLRLFGARAAKPREPTIAARPERAFSAVEAPADDMPTVAAPSRKDIEALYALDVDDEATPANEPAMDTWDRVPSRAGSGVSDTIRSSDWDDATDMPTETLTITEPFDPAEQFPTLRVGPIPSEPTAPVRPALPRRMTPAPRAEPPVVLTPRAFVLLVLAFMAAGATITLAVLYL